tara:strand:- start:25 stop:132 length:108 start_codon:yes stop_codon:yes gene_type:complete
MFGICGSDINLFKFFLGELKQEKVFILLELNKGEN